jgi:hypothetical protein
MTTKIDPSKNPTVERHVRGFLHELNSGLVLVSCPRNSMYFVAIKMGRRQGGPSRTGSRGSISESIRDRRATQPPGVKPRIEEFDAKAAKRSPEEFVISRNLRGTTS